MPPHPTPTPAGCYALWNSSVAYNAGATITYNGVNYSANWYTQGQNPATNSGPGRNRHAMDCRQCLHTNTNTYAHTYTYTYAHAHADTYADTYPYAYTDTYAHSHESVAAVQAQMPRSP